MKTLKPQVNQIDVLNKRLSKVAIKLQEFKKLAMMPNLFNETSCDNSEQLNKKNRILQKQVNNYEKLLVDIVQRIDIIVNTLQHTKTFNEK